MSARRASVALGASVRCSSAPLRPSPPAHGGRDPAYRSTRRDAAAGPKPTAFAHDAQTGRAAGEGSFRGNMPSGIDSLSFSLSFSGLISPFQDRRRLPRTTRSAAKNCLARLSARVISACNIFMRFVQKFSKVGKRRGRGGRATRKTHPPLLEFESDGLAISSLRLIDRAGN